MTTDQFLVSVAALCWVLVAFAAGIIVFSENFDDTVLERIGLSWIAIAAIAASYNLMHRGSVSGISLFISLGFGFYSAALLLKFIPVMLAESRREQRG